MTGQLFPPAVLHRGEVAVTRPNVIPMFRKFAVKTTTAVVDAAAPPCSPARRGTQSSDPLPVVDDTTAAPSALPCAGRPGG